MPREKSTQAEKMLFVSVNPHSLKKSLKKTPVCVFALKLFSFLAMLLDLRGNEKAEVKEVPLSYQPSFLETQGSEI